MQAEDEDGVRLRNVLEFIRRKEAGLPDSLPERLRGESTVNIYAHLGF